MLAHDSEALAQFGNLNSDVHKPATFKYELLKFLSNELPHWRDRPDRIKEASETILTSQLCAHLNSAARKSTGWDILQFRVEAADEQHKDRKIDLVPSSCGASIFIEGRRHTDFDILMPIECKRLPTPNGTNRDEREYVISKYSSIGGIQRFKAGHHGATHTLGAMIGYVQEETTVFWDERIKEWIKGLVDVIQGWTKDDFLRSEGRDGQLRLAISSSSHKRQDGLPDIELRHFWIEMN